MNVRPARIHFQRLLVLGLMCLRQMEEREPGSPLLHVFKGETSGRYVKTIGKRKEARNFGARPGGTGLLGGK